jgi:uncharacterized Zn finger protein
MSRRQSIKILCEQCGGNHYVREVKVYNSTENEVVFLCGYCDYLNTEELKKITPPSLDISAINLAGDKLRKKKGKKRPYRVKRLTFEQIEAL